MDRMDTRKATGLIVGDFTITRDGHLLPRVSEDLSDRCAIQVIRTKFTGDDGKPKERFGLHWKRGQAPTWWAPMHQQLAETIIIDFADRLQAAALVAGGKGFIQTPLLEERDG